jgi:hypothetical protein
MSANWLLAMISEHLKHVPGELILKGIHRHDEKKAEHAQAAMNTMSAFMEAVVEQNHDAANSLCTPELQADFKPNAITAFKKIREHLMSTTAVSLTETPQLKWFGTSCHLSGIINYPGDQSAHFFLDVEWRHDQWKVNAYEFDAVPLAVRELEERLAGKPGDEGGSCPADYPIKASSKNIYHLPSGRHYAATRAVRCFATEADAKTAGFRPSRR